MNGWFSKIDRNSLPGFGAILLWSTTVALAKSLSEKLGGFTGGAAVYFLGGIICLIFGLLRGSRFENIRALPFRHLAVCGALFVLYMATFYGAVGLTTDRHQVMEIGLINYLWPAMTILFSIPIGGKRASWLLLPGTLVAVAGVLLSMSEGAGGDFSWQAFAAHIAGHPLPYSLALIAAVSWGVYSNLTSRLLGSKGDGTIPFFMLATGVVLLALRFVSGESSTVSLKSGGELLSLSLITSLGYIWWDMAMRKGNLVLVAAASYLTPLLSTLVIILYLGASAGPRLWLGCVMIVTGSFLSWISISPAKQS